MDYTTLSDALLNWLDRRIALVLKAYDTLLSGSSPEWYDDLHFERFKIQRELARRRHAQMDAHTK